MVAVWPERLYGIDFFENSSEIRDSNLVEIDENWSESDLRQGKQGSDIAKLIGEGLGTSWNGSKPLKPKSKIKKSRFWGLGGRWGPGGSVVLIFSFKRLYI